MLLNNFKLCFSNRPTLFCLQQFLGTKLGVELLLKYCSTESAKFSSTAQWDKVFLMNLQSNFYRAMFSHVFFSNATILDILKLIAFEVLVACNHSVQRKYIFGEISSHLPLFSFRKVFKNIFCIASSL